MTNFKCFVVRHDVKDPDNFVELTNVPSALMLQETWKRSDIKEVHVIAQTIAFVAKTADALRLNMLPLRANVTDTIPLRLQKRESSTDLLRPALKHDGEGFQKELERHAK